MKVQSGNEGCPIFNKSIDDTSPIPLQGSRGCYQAQTLKSNMNPQYISTSTAFTITASWHRVKPRTASDAGTGHPRPASRPIFHAHVHTLKSALHGHDRRLKPMLHGHGRSHSLRPVPHDHDICQKSAPHDHDIRQ